MGGRIREKLRGLVHLQYTEEMEIAIDDLEREVKDIVDVLEGASIDDLGRIDEAREQAQSLAEDLY